MTNSIVTPSLLDPISGNVKLIKNGSRKNVPVVGVTIDIGSVCVSNVTDNDCTGATLVAKSVNPNSNKYVPLCTKSTFGTTLSTSLEALARPFKGANVTVCPSESASRTVSANVMTLAAAASLFGPELNVAVKTILPGKASSKTSNEN